MGSPPLRPPAFHPHGPRGLFHARRPDHVPPQTLSDAQLDEAIASLNAKLHSARRALLMAQLAGLAFTLALLVAGFVLLWFGPYTYLGSLFGWQGASKSTGVWLWWVVIIAIAVVGGAFGDQLLRGRLRLSRGWRYRVDELELRLHDAESIKSRRRART